MNALGDPNRTKVDVFLEGSLCLECLDTAPCRTPPPKNVKHTQDVL